MKKGILLVAVMLLMAALSHANEKAVKLVEKAVRAELGNPAGLVFKESTFYGGDAISITCGYYKTGKDKEYHGYIAWGNKVIMFEQSFVSKEEFKKSWKSQCKKQ